LCFSHGGRGFLKIKMKILTVTPYYYPALEYGGPIFSLRALNRALREKGCEVNVYTTSSYLKGKVKEDRECEVDEIKTVYFSYNSFLDFLGSNGWQFSPSLARALKKNLPGFDVAHISGIWSYPALVAAYYCRKYNKPYIITPHGMLYPETLRKKGWKKYLYLGMVLKRFLQGAAAVHYTCNDEARCHGLLGLSGRALVLPNGIELSSFARIPERGIFSVSYPQFKGRCVILFLGRLVWKKGLDILIAAFKELVRQRKDAHLVIAGNSEGDYRAKVEKMVKDTGLCEYVTFTGALCGQRKLEAYAGSDVFVLPSYSENFGIAVAEAMACGLPVVISDKVGISPEIKEANAGVIVSCDKESLRRGLLSVLDNAEFARRLSENGRAFARNNYDIQKVAVNFINACAEIIKERAELIRKNKEDS